MTERERTDPPADYEAPVVEDVDVCAGTVESASMIQPISQLD